MNTEHLLGECHCIQAKSIRSLHAFILILSVLFLSACMASPLLKNLSAKDYYSDPVQIKLLQGIKRENAAMIREAVAEGADVNLEGNKQIRPVYWAMATHSPKGFAMLLEHDVDLTIWEQEKGVAVTGYYGPLSLAAKMKDTSYLQAAAKKIKSTYPSNEFTRVMREAMEAAMINRRMDNIKLLIAEGYQINEHEPEQDPILTRVVNMRYFELAYYLLMNGADPHLNTTIGYNSVDFIRMHGNRAIRENKDRKFYHEFVAELKRRGDLPLDFEFDVKTDPKLVREQIQAERAAKKAD